MCGCRSAECVLEALEDTHRLVLLPSCQVGLQLGLSLKVVERVLASADPEVPNRFQKRRELPRTHDRYGDQFALLNERILWVTSRLFVLIRSHAFTALMTLNQRVPGSSPGAPTNPCNLAGNTEGGMASSKPDRLREFRAIR
jgi:hypothetical protein